MTPYGFRWRNPYDKIDSHGPEWYHYANAISDKLRLDPPITRTSDVPEESEMRNGAKWTLECSECGYKYNYFRRTKTIDYVLSNPRHSMRGKCGACKKNAEFTLVED